MAIKATQTRLVVGSSTEAWDFSGVSNSLDVSLSGEKMEINDEGTRLKLQALERLTLFAERIGLQNLVNRSHNSNMSATLMQQTLVETIKSEHEYNATQQIYVNPEIWGAVTRLKDQNIYIINQLAAPLPHNATAMDLSKRIIEYSLQENAQLNNIVIDALRFEAQKLTD